MKQGQFTQEQIVKILQEAEKGEQTIGAICREQGITETTFYRWRAKYDGAAVVVLREVRDLRDENLKLKQIVANLLLEKQALGDPRRRN